MRRKAPNELSVFGGGGYSFLFYHPALSGVHGISSKGFGADLGGSFTAFSGKYVGFHIGLGFGINNINVLVDSFTFVTPNFYAPNLFGDNQPYDLHTNLSGYNEKYRTYFLTIPVMLQFQTTPKRVHRDGINKCFYAMTGVKLNILIKRQYEMEVKELQNMAYFTQLGNWAGTQTFANLGHFKGSTSNGQQKNFMPVFTFEAGIKWYSTNKMNFYTGVYFDCALSDPTKDNKVPFNNYISEEDFQKPSLLKYSNRANVMTVGIKLRLAFFDPKKALLYR